MQNGIQKQSGGSPYFYSLLGFQNRAIGVQRLRLGLLRLAHLLETRKML